MTICRSDQAKRRQVRRDGSQQACRINQHHLGGVDEAESGACVVGAWEIWRGRQLESLRQALASLPKFGSLRSLAVTLIVFLAVLPAGWFTALWVAGVVGALVLLGMVWRAGDQAQA